MSDQPRLEEKAISEIVKTILTNQVDSIKRIAVDIQTNVLKLIQGQADSIEVSGQGIVTEDIHIKEVQVQTDEVSIDPLSVFLGKVRLNEPIDTKVRMVLTEADLNHTMNSDLVIENLKPLCLDVDGAVVSVELQPPFRIRLLPKNKIRFTGILNVQGGKESRQTTFTSVICPRTETHPILLETFCCSPDQGSSIPFMISILRKMESLVSLPYFDFGSAKLRIVSLAVQERNLIIEIDAQAEQILSL